MLSWQTVKLISTKKSNGKNLLFAKGNIKPLAWIKKQQECVQSTRMPYPHYHFYVQWNVKMGKNL